MNVIKRLRKYGHLNVNDDQARRLSIGDQIVQDAVASYQRMWHTELTALSPNGVGLVDGWAGPVTETLLRQPRCACADFALETGRGSWPVGCHPDWPNNHAFTINVDKSGMPSYLNDVFEPAYESCRASYADVGIAFVREDGNRRANTQVTFVRGSGWIGLAIVPNSPQCGEVIWAKYDNRYRPADLENQWARLLAHEFGHNMGMGHITGGTMNPFIIGGEYTRTQWRGDPSFPKLERFFGGKPIGGEGPKDPEPPPQHGDLRIEPNQFQILDDAGNVHGKLEIKRLPPGIG